MLNRNADDNQPASLLEDKMYKIDELGVYNNIISAVFDDAGFSGQVAKEQTKDDVITEAKDIVASKGQIMRGRLKRVRGQLRIENDVLTKAGRPIVPPSLRRYVLKTLHNIGHFGIDTTYKMVKSRFYWPGLFKAVELFVKCCETCQRTKVDHQPPKAPLLPILVASEPMQFLSIDIAYMPVDETGFRYLLLLYRLVLMCDNAMRN